jgi:hypothetical protein
MVYKLTSPLYPAIISGTDQAETVTYKFLFLKDCLTGLNLQQLKLVGYSPE